MYSLTGILEKAALLEAQGIAHNAAYIEAIKAMYPKDYSEILSICKEHGANPESEIPALIENLIRERGIKTAPENAPGTVKRTGLEELKNYARGITA